MVMTDLVIKAVNEVTGNEVMEDAAEEAAKHPVSKGDAVAEVEMDPELRWVCQNSWIAQTMQNLTRKTLMMKNQMSTLPLQYYLLSQGEVRGSKRECYLLKG